MASASSSKEQRESRRLSSGLSMSRARLAKVRSRSRGRPMDLPDRFKNVDDEGVDDGTGIGGDDPLFAQSVYGMLAATQSRANFPTRFQQESGSESEADVEDSSRRAGETKKVRSKESSRKQKGEAGGESRQGQSESKGHRKRLSESGGKLVRSFLKPVRERADPMTQSQFLPARDKPRLNNTTAEPNIHTTPDAPVLDRKLQAMARAQMEASTTSTKARRSTEGRPSTDSLKEKANASLPQVIANIFQFDEPEVVVSEYPCWYLQNVLLQGYMYITQKHICFYSYLQKKTNVTVKSGHLGKQGKHSYGYHRYWFVLKGDVFSYYKGSAEPYFPLGQVDLRYAISVDLVKEKDKEATDFTITTPTRVYYYRADTPSSAADWIKHLQKVTFRSHNDGDSVKISLPIENVLDVEQTSVVDFAETVKLRVIANDETFAVDEYFFTFFNSGKEALETLRSLTDGNAAKGAQVDEERMQALHNIVDQSPRVQDRVRSTLSPQSAGGPASPRLSGEYRRSSADISRSSLDRGRSSFDRDRRSASVASGGRSASKSPLSPSIHESTESFVTTSEHQSSSANEDAIDDNMSASQMLTGDGVFRGPTLRMPQPRRTVSGSTVERLRRESHQSSSRESSTERVRIQPPTRQHTEQSLSHCRPDLQRQESGESSHTLEADEQHRLHPPDATAGPNKLVRGISTPLQHAMTVAGMVRSSGKRMGSYLSSSPKTYIGNWSTAIAGGKRHYTDVEGLAPDDSIREPEHDLDVAEHERRFQEHFGLPPTERLLAVFYCWLHKTVPLYGKIYMGSRRFCFRSLWYGIKTKLVIPYKDILNVQKQRGFRWGYPGMILVIRGYEELFFDFPSVGLRDDAVVTVLKNLDTMQAAAESMILTEEEQQDAEEAAAEHELLQAARKDGYADHDLELPENIHQVEPDAPPILFDDPSASVLDFKPKEPMRITCLTIGSRGDVQPYIALCKGIMADGHRCKIATHLLFKDWVESHGIEFAEVTGDPAELMRVCVENGMFTPSFFLEVNSKFRTWLDDLLDSSYEACKGSDLLIESPSVMCGIHIAEALEIPYFRAFTMPWTRTRAYPHAFAVPSSKMGGGYNYMTYTFFDNLFWQAIAGQINRWRAKSLGLGATSLDKLQQNKVPFLYNFSPNVVIPPLDFSDWIKITGYWFLDEGKEWEPPAELAAFIKRTRDDKRKLVYIGFGSVTVSDSRQLMQQVVDAVVKADVNCILAKGWSDRYDKADPTAVPIELPSSIHQINSAPHDWLFKQVDAVVHHGGAGTTGASLRAGKPTLIRPFFGDQYFFATRVEDLGVGQYLKKLTGTYLGKALWLATKDERMSIKAAKLGECIRSENGVQTAINAIYRDLDYAKSLIKKRPQKPEDMEGGSLSEDTEENWTFVEPDSEPDMTAAKASEARRQDRQKSLGSIVMKR